jgi:hypothetical protein
MFMPSAPLTDYTAENQAVLNDLAHLGNRLARLAVEQAEATTISTAEAGKTFEHVTLSVRRCVWLIRRLAEPVKTVDRVAARKRIIRDVEDAIQRTASDPEAEDLREELMDRLESSDLEDEIENRPVEDIIKDIIHDLGLAARLDCNPWKRRTPQDLALLQTQAASPIRRRNTS